MDEIRITGDGLVLTLRVGGYEYENATQEDANWLRGSVLLEVTGGVSARFDARLVVAWTTSQLVDFNEALRTLLEDLTGTAHLSTLEDQVELKIELEKGRGTLSGRVEEHALAALEFEDVMTDQSQLVDASRALSQIVRRYPSRP